MPASIDSLLWVPYASLSDATVTRIKKALTIKPRGFGGDEPKPIKCWFDDDSGTKLGLPIHFGLTSKLVQGNLGSIEQCFSYGFETFFSERPDPHHPKAAPGQAKFMADVLAAVRKEFVVLAEAPTGTGKTVVVLNTAAELGVTTLVVVPNKSVAQQWEDEIVKHLGAGREHIGRVEEGQYRYEWCPIVIAVIHNLAQKQFPEEFYSYFGFVAFDECQVLGAPSFAQTMYQFPARYKMATSATPDRRDGCENVFLYYFGPPAVISEAEALAADCYVIPYKKPGNPYPAAMPPARQLNCLVRDSARNELILKKGILAFHTKDRCALIVGARVEHLQLLMALSYEAGIPEKSMGLFIRQWVTEEGKKKSFPQSHLEDIKADSNIRFIFATYGMFKYAIDIPRLDAGIDVTPQAEGVQMIGRIRRPLPGKKRPVWLTIHDVGNVTFSRYLACRLREFRANNVTVHN